MRRAAPLAAALLLLSAGPGAGQHLATGDPLAGVPDVPAGSGALKVRIEHDARPEAVAGLKVVLYALPEDSPPGLRGGVTDRRGELVFEGISADPAIPYLVGMRFDDVPFASRVRFAPGESAREVLLQISDPSPDTSRAGIGEIELRFEPSCSGVHVTESWEVRNAGRQVIRVDPSERGGRRPILEAELPREAVGFGAGSGGDGLERVGRSVRFWGPLQPGSQVVDWSYGIPAGAGLEQAFPARASQVVVLHRPRGPRPSGPGLEPGRPRSEADGEWIAAVAKPTDGRLELRLDGGDRPDPGALSLRRAQLWVELDDAALRVDEVYDVETVEGHDATLWCLPLPGGAEELRFSNASLALGLARDPAGDLAVRGPFPPGPFVLSLRYLLPRDAGTTGLARSFSLPVPWLSIYVADTGLLAESERLHRRRPMLTEDRTYMHFEAFGIEAGEAMALRLEPLPAGRRAPRTAVAAFLGLSAAAALAFLAGPLRRRGAGDAAPEAPRESLERESLEAALHDLEHDFETGKLAPEDYETIGAELRARARALERAAEPAAPAAPDRCPRCDAPAPPQARFCAQCGKRLPRSRGPAD